MMVFSAYTILLAIAMLIGLFQCLVVLIEGRTYYPLATLFASQVALIGALMVKPVSFSMVTMWAVNPLLVILGAILLATMLLSMLRMMADERIARNVAPLAPVVPIDTDYDYV